MNSFTPYHCHYWAQLLTLRGAGSSIENLTRSISNARVDLNPHQVEAALFALRSPLSKGAILADEVGLGKTIEAGIVLSQRWAERRRRILLIVPATLRKQWQLELDEKFFLPSIILESRLYNQTMKQGLGNPFSQEEQIVICSYHFASAKAADIERVPWDMVVIDEAHRLRNVFRRSSKMARRISDSIGHAHKMLLTATPLQNSLMELYGLVSVIDDHVFGDAPSFRDQFVRASNESQRNVQLRERLQPVCTRTLRKQVVEYIPYTNRIPITQDFTPSDEEQELYDRVSAFLQRDRLISLPASQRQLITLVLRKLMASSTFAIAKTLRGLVGRLRALEVELARRIVSADQEVPLRSNGNNPLIDEEEFETLSELEDEWVEEQDEPDSVPAETDLRIDPDELKAELQELVGFADLADRITANAKGEALVPALATAFRRADELGAERKAIVFTESRRTQQYLIELLSERGYDGQLVLMNGTNTDPLSKEIYGRWKERHEGKEVVSGSRPVDVKTAIIEEFRDRATIMVATEAAAEGVNLQFCSLVVNFDLPWNPQRVEQRIGRCHRYGQKHDVVVVNFLNRRNEADLRVFQLLNEKFKLFSGIFGASDEVLGALESGVDIERRIAAVYQQCRNPAEITAAFDKLQSELDDQIQLQLADTRELLLKNFDEDVAARLRVNRDKTLESLSDRERWLLELTRAELRSDARFDESEPRFEYLGDLASSGFYHLDWRKAEETEDTFYRAELPLAAHVIETALGHDLPPSTLSLDYGGYGSVVSALEPFLGKSGHLELSKLSIESLESEDFLILAGCLDDGDPLDDEICRKLLLLPASVSPRPVVPSPQLEGIRDREVEARVRAVELRNSRFFDEEVLKLDHWSDDLKQSLEREIKDLDKEIREARKLAALSGALADKLEAQKTIKALEATRKDKRKRLFEAQDEIDGRRDDLIGKIEAQLQRRQSIESLFFVQWTLN